MPVLATSLLPISQPPAANPNPNPNPNKRLKLEENKMMEEEEERNWAELQVDVLTAIFWRVPMRDVFLSAGPVCSSWWKVSREEPVLWKMIDVVVEREYRSRSMAMVRLAVDRSKGGLEEFWVGGYVDDDLLEYVADRASNLKSLRLISCVRLSDTALEEAVKKLEMLEEVEITHCRFPIEVVDTIGLECPLLQRLKLKHSFNARDTEELGDYPPLSIGAFMPQIRYLQLFGGSMTNDGLKAILHGCCNLEVLDIRDCWSVQMDAEMRVLSSKLKKLVLPDHILVAENEFVSETAGQAFLYVSDDEDEEDNFDGEYNNEEYYFDYDEEYNNEEHYAGYDASYDLIDLSYLYYDDDFMMRSPTPLVCYSRVATLRPESKNWALKLRLLNKSGQFVSRDGAKTYQRLIFIDEDGTKIQSTLFNGDIVDVGNRFTTNQVYHISNAEIAEVQLHFRVVDNQYQLKLSRRASVHELEQDHFKVKDDNYNFVPLCSEMTIGDTVDILAVVINVGPVREVSKQCGETSLVRHVTVIDHSLKPTLLSLWGNFARDEGEVLSKNLHNFPIIAALFVTVSSFAGPSFSTKSRTVILINPDMAKAKELRQWVDNNSRSVVMSHMGISLPSFSREPGESSSSAPREIAESSSSFCVELENAS